MKVWSRLPRVHLLVYLSYLAAAVILTWPLVTVFSTRLIGHPFGDSYEYIRHIWWFKQALQTGAPLFFHPLLAYPDGLAGAWLWAIPLQSFPAWLFAFVMPLPAAFNLSVLLTLALNGWSVYVLMRGLMTLDEKANISTQNHAAAWLAGLVFMAYPTFQGQLAAGHSGLLALWGVPLYAHALFRLRQSGERRWVIWGAIFFLVSLLGRHIGRRTHRQAGTGQQP